MDYNNIKNLIDNIQNCMLLATSEDPMLLIFKDANELIKYKRIIDNNPDEFKDRYVLRTLNTIKYHQLDGYRFKDYRFM